MVIDKIVEDANVHPRNSGIQYQYNSSRDTRLYSSLGLYAQDKGDGDRRRDRNRDGSGGGGKGGGRRGGQGDCGGDRRRDRNRDGSCGGGCRRDRGDKPKK